MIKSALRISQFLLKTPINCELTGNIVNWMSKLIPLTVATSILIILLKAFHMNISLII